MNTNTQGAHDSVEGLVAVAKQIKLERDQAVAALKLIMEAAPDLYKLIDALHAARTLLTKVTV